jgi:hypothetical protein
MGFLRGHSRGSGVATLRTEFLARRVKFTSGPRMYDLAAAKDDHKMEAEPAGSVEPRWVPNSRGLKFYVFCYFRYSIE